MATNSYPLALSIFLLSGQVGGRVKALGRLTRDPLNCTQKNTKSPCGKYGARRRSLAANADVTGIAASGQLRGRRVCRRLVLREIQTPLRFTSEEKGAPGLSGLSGRDDCVLRAG